MSELHRFETRPRKCVTCYLRYHCDEQTEFICRANNYCKYMNDGGRKHGYLIAHYECSVCGQSHSRPVTECSFCKAIMETKDTFDREYNAARSEMLKKRSADTGINIFECFDKEINDG